MSSKSDYKYLPIFSSGHYYSKDEFQFPLSASLIQVDRPSVLKNQDGISLLLFRKGEGEIVINSVTYPLRPGLLICLGSYHYFKFIPKEEPLEFVQCRLSYDAFLYMAANPYYNFSTLTLNIEPLATLLSGQALERASRVFDDLIRVTEWSRAKKSEKEKGGNLCLDTGFTHKSGDMEFYLCMRLMGILQKYYSNEFWEKIKD